MPKTVRSKITLLFTASLGLIGLLTLLYYENIFALEKKLLIVEAFDDLRDQVMEMRRYEKNATYYRDTESLNESVVYLFQAEDSLRGLEPEIRRVLGAEKFEQFNRDLQAYKGTVEENLAAIKAGTDSIDVEQIRERGRVLVDWTQLLIATKRRRINRALRTTLHLHVALAASFVVLVLLIIQFIARRMLRPLDLLEKATEHVGKGTFAPIPYGANKKDEISQLIHAFNRMAAEIDSRQEQLVQSRKMASIGTFTSGIAHELNNPINNISLMVEALMEDGETMGPQERERLYQDLMEQADRSSEIVRNLLEFSRTDRPHLEPVSIGELVDRTARLLKNEMKIRHIGFTKEVRGEIPVLVADPGGLKQVFLNLLLNSIQAVEEGGKISVVIGVDEKANGVRVDIRDTGRGIPAHDLEHIFDPFFTTKKEGEGTGLGLSVTYNIIRQHGGRIQVESEPGKGTHFSIFLPLRGGHEQT